LYPGEELPAEAASVFLGAKSVRKARAICCLGAEDVKDDIEIEAGPLGRPQQLGDVPTSELIGAGGQPPQLLVRGMGDSLDGGVHEFLSSLATVARGIPNNDETLLNVDDDPGAGQRGASPRRALLAPVSEGRTVEALAAEQGSHGSRFLVKHHGAGKAAPRNVSDLRSSGRKLITGYTPPHSERLQKPDYDRDHNHDVQNSLDAGGHGDVVVD
jgi:hypothetical protein